MRARALRSWIDGLEDDDEVALEAVFPEVDGWAVQSCAVVARPNENYEGEGLILSMEVYATDFDYGEVWNKLKRAIAKLPDSQ